MAKKKFSAPALEVVRYDENTRLPLFEQIDFLRSILGKWTAAGVPFLLSNVAPMNYFCLFVDGSAAPKARTISPELFGEKDKLSYGKTIYIRYTQKPVNLDF